MANDYTQTDNYGLSLYGDQSPADFRDGHNNNMRIIDQQLKTTNDATAKGTSAKNILDHIGWTDNDKAADWINNAEQNETQTTANTNALTALNAETTEKATNLKNDIYKLTYNGHALIFGDSIAAGYDASPRDTARWSTRLCNNLGIQEHNYAVAGAYFAADSSDTGNTINGQVAKAVADETAPKQDVRLILIEGGVNNSNERTNAASVYSEIIQMGDSLQAAYPNARIIYLLNMNGGEKHTKLIGLSVIWVRYVAKKILENGKYGVIDCTNWLQGATDYIEMKSPNDFIHPNTLGHAYIAGKLLSILKYGVNPENSLSTLQWSFDEYLPIVQNETTAQYIKTITNALRIYINDSMIQITGSIQFTFKDELTEAENNTLDDSFEFTIGQLPLTIGKSYEQFQPAIAIVNKWKDIETEGQVYSAYIAHTNIISDSVRGDGYYNLNIQAARINKYETTTHMGANGKMTFHINHTIPMPAI